MEDIDIQPLKNSVSEMMEKLLQIKETLQQIDINTEEGLQTRTNVRKKLLEFSHSVQAFNGQVTLLVEEETAMIKNNLKKREENLAKIQKSLNDMPVEKEEPEKEQEKEYEPRAWADIVAKEMEQQQQSKAQKSPIARRGILPISPGNIIQRQITHGVTIAAFTIKDPAECMKREHLGFWCYSTDTLRYHTCLNKVIISAAPTNITPRDETPRKFLEHRNCSNRNYKPIDYKETDYYIPPEVDPTSKDVRCLSDRMHFWPASWELPPKDTSAYRLGSMDTLKADLSYMTPADYRLQMDITGLFMLVITVAGARMDNLQRLGGI